MAKNAHRIMSIAKIEENKSPELKAPIVCIGILIRLLSRVGR
jgi:hypothetical protein